MVASIRTEGVCSLQGHKEQPCQDTWGLDQYNQPS